MAWMISGLWPERRAAELSERFVRIGANERCSYTFLPSDETDFIKYFPDALHTGIRSGLSRFEYVSPASLAEADVAIVTCHGSDMSAQLWEIREQLRDDAVLALWLWDNHLGQVNNVKSSLCADITFPSHAYAADYLFNPLCPIVHLPACSAQWTAQEAAALFERHGRAERIHKLLVNYVDYEFSPRSPLLHALRDGMPEADVFLMDKHDRGRYFSLAPDMRFAEWARYKTTVILPVDRDLSTRLFDALLAGLIPIVPTAIADFDFVVPPEQQEELGVVRVDSMSLDAIRDATHTALSRFDQLGLNGCELRHRYARNHHMLSNRIDAILGTIQSIGTSSIQMVFSDSDRGPGIHLIPGGVE